MLCSWWRLSMIIYIPDFNDFTLLIVFKIYFADFKIISKIHYRWNILLVYNEYWFVLNIVLFKHYNEYYDAKYVTTLAFLCNWWKHLPMVNVFFRKIDRNIKRNELVHTFSNFEKQIIWLILPVKYACLKN